MYWDRYSKSWFQYKKRLFSQISLWYHNFIFNLKIKLYYFSPPKKKTLWLVTCITWNWHIIFIKKNRENYIDLVLMKNYCWTNTSDSWCRLIPLCYLEIIPKKNDSLHTDLVNLENTGERKESMLILLLRHHILVMLLLIMNLILFLKEIY